MLSRYACVLFYVTVAADGRELLLCSAHSCRCNRHFHLLLRWMMSACALRLMYMSRELCM
jgi:hypothetical protein